MSGQEKFDAPSIDQIPSDPAALAALSPEERCAAYLNSIRKAMSFFVILAVAAVVLSLVAIVNH